MTGSIVLVCLLVAAYIVLMTAAYRALFRPVVKRKRKMLRLCASHSAERRKPGVWILDGSNCARCKGSKGKEA